LTALFFAVAPASAQEWPVKAVKIVVPFAAGSTPDVVARLIADELQQKHHGTPFVVENKPGASGNTGTDAVAKAAPDGYTLGVSIGGPLAINTVLFSKLPYDPIKDLAPITQLVSQPSVLAVSTRVRANDVLELISALKQEPNKYTYGSIGNGSLSHLALEAIALHAGIKLVHVPYAGSGQAMTALLRDDVQIACLPAIAVMPHRDSGKIKVLAVSTGKRSPYLPETPTLKESGVDVEADAWMGLIAPAGVAQPLLEGINKEVIEILQRPSVREKLSTQLMEPVGSSSIEFQALLRNETVRWGHVIKASGIKMN
jgi:tripartite-type tricarboxylate transporter receptor subunit TctC